MHAYFRTNMPEAKFDESNSQHRFKTKISHVPILFYFISASSNMILKGTTNKVYTGWIRIC